MRALGHALVRRTRHEDGWAMVTALILMSIMITIGLASYAFVDQQTNESRRERVRETAFNFAEGALTAQIFGLTQNWPGPGLAANPVPTCTPSTTDSRCPSAPTLASLFTSSDTAADASWQTQVRDNDSTDTARLGRTYYSDALTAGQPGYDRNDDDKVWVRAQATARGKTRTLVALARVETQQEDLPHNALIAGRVTFETYGKGHLYVDASAAASPSVLVRCTPELSESSPCLGHTLGLAPLTDLAKLTDLLNVQINGSTVTGYTGGKAMTDASLARLKARAVADGTYYTSCPTAAQLTGAVVFIDYEGLCSYTANTQINSTTAPGALILGGTTTGSTRIQISGTVDFYGLLYATNPAGSSAELVRLTGNENIHGGVLVDGLGSVWINGNASIILDNGALNGVKSFGTAGIIQNTWREIKP